jgi:hypothetical protein
MLMTAFRVETLCGLAGGYQQKQALKMKAAWSSGTLISTHKSSRRYKPEDQQQQLHHRQELIL